MSAGEAWVYIVVSLIAVIFGTVTWVWTIVNFVWDGELVYYLAALITALWVTLLILGVWGLRRAVKELKELKTSTVG